MNIASAVINRIAVILVVTFGSVLVSVGLAAAGHADPGYAPTTTVTAPIQHPAFPNQHNAPQPGTQTHHDHQNNRS